MALSGFDESFYLDGKLTALKATYQEWTTKTTADLKATLQSMGFTPEQHYQKFGYAEGLNPNKYFNSDQYVLFKAKSMFAANLFISIDAAKAAFLKAWPTNPYDHYLKYGGTEGIDPSNLFDSSAYLTSKLADLKADNATLYSSWTTADVAKAIANAGMTPLGHYLQYGKTEGVDPTPVPLNEAISDEDIATPGASAVLTVNQDTVVGAKIDGPIFTSTMTGAQIQTLTTVDKITGTSAVTDVLNATLNGTEASTKPTINGIETVNLTAILPIASVFDAENSAGIKLIGSVDSSANLTIRNLAAGTNAQVISTAGSVSTLFQYANSVVSGTTDSVTLYANNIGRGDVALVNQRVNLRGETAGGFETLNVVSTGAASRLLDLGSDPTVGIGVSSTAVGNALRTVNVTGDANFRVDNALLNVTKVDATGFTGNLRVSLDAAKDVTVIGGKGADRFNFAGGLTNTDSVDGGDGRDTIVVTTNTAIADGNKISNVEILHNQAGAATIYNLAKVASLDAVIHDSTFAGTYNNMTKVGAADVTKGVTQLNTGAVTVSVADAGGLGSNSDVLQVTVGTATQLATFVAGAITTGAVETINVKVVDVAGLTATAGGAFINADAALGTVNFTGGSVGTIFWAGGMGGSGINLTKIDGSAFIGNLWTAGNAFSQVIKGGSGDDFLSTGGRQAFADTVAADSLSGGAGSDTFVFANSDAALTSANVTTAAASTADGISELTAITDLNLGGNTVATAVDRINVNALTTMTADAVIVVNSGIASAMAGATLGIALDTLVNAGGVLAPAVAAANTYAGLFTYGADTFLVAANATATGDTFGAGAAGTDLVIKVTGVTGTLDTADFIV